MASIPSSQEEAGARHLGGGGGTGSPVNRNGMGVEELEKGNLGGDPVDAAAMIPETSPLSTLGLSAAALVERDFRE